MEAEQSSGVAFYDDKIILLTSFEPLREARVEEVFDEHNLSVFKGIGDVDGASPYTGTSLLHSRRILCYTSTQFIPYEYNVDTRVNKRIEIGRKVRIFSSLMGIDPGVKAVFQDGDNIFTYTLGWDNKVTPFHEVREGALASLFVSTTYPKDLSKSMLKYDDYLIKGVSKMEPREPISFEGYQSVIRVYRDIFLLYDMNIDEWVLTRILVP